MWQAVTKETINWALATRVWAKQVSKKKKIILVNDRSDIFPISNIGFFKIKFKLSEGFYENF